MSWRVSVFLYFQGEREREYVLGSDASYEHSFLKHFANPNKKVHHDIYIQAIYVKH
jgi:hypothetical protein